MVERLRRMGRIMGMVAASGLLAACGDDHHRGRATPTSVPTATQAATATATALASATRTSANSATPSQMATTTATATREATTTTTPVATATATPPATVTVTATPSSSPTPSQVATATGSATPTFTPTPTATPEAECAIAADTGLGVICGTTAAIAGGTAHAFLGIPYAEDTAGDNRWAPPVPVTSLPDRFQATQFGPICPQAMRTESGPAPSEDCLSINVWTPIERGGEPLPVMVFLHGGAFIWGSSAAPTVDAAYLSAAEKVVVANVNYRLGALGFLAGIAGLEGNYGFLDQQLALRWVQDNIAAFGGDPTQVTIFGESAGAMSVGLHLLSAPGSEALFDAAIMESNPFALPYKTVAESAQFGTLLAGLLDCEQNDLACLRGTAWEAVVAAQEDPSIVIPGLLSGFGGLLLWTPVLDGAVITAEPVAAAVAGGLPKPTLLGTNRDEGTVFVYGALDILGEQTLAPGTYEVLINGLFGGTTGAEILLLYPPATDSAPVASQLITDYLFFCASRFVAETGDDQTFAYQFDRVSSFNFWPNVPACADQVCHADELPYVFNTASHIGFSFTAAEEALSRDVVGYWGAFSRPGHDPGPPGSGRPAWPPFPGRNYLLLDTPITSAVDPPHNCDFWDDVGYGAIDASAMLSGR